MPADVTITISIKGGEVSSVAEASPPAVHAQGADLAPPPDVEEPDIAPPTELEAAADVGEPDIAPPTLDDDTGADIGDAADIAPPTLDDDESAAVSVPEVPHE